MSKAIELLEETKVAALVFEAHREETPKIVTATIKEVFDNINQALALLDIEPTEFRQNADERIVKANKVLQAKGTEQEALNLIEILLIIKDEACVIIDQQQAELTCANEQCGGLQENVEKLQAENKNWKDRYIEAVNDMAALKRRIEKLEQALKKS